MTHSPCSFCSEFRSESENNAFLKFCPESSYTSRVVDHSSSYLVLPTIGQMVEGYMLICTREHYPSIGASLLHAPRTEEFRALLGTVKDTMEAACGSGSIVFEHGPASRQVQAGSCVDHAHLHIVPVQKDLMGYLALEPRMTWSPCDGYAPLVDCARRGVPYLYYADWHGNGYLAAVKEAIPSQYLRQVLARMLGMPGHWDWRTKPYPERVERAIRRYRENGCSLPGHD